MDDRQNTIFRNTNGGVGGLATTSAVALLAGIAAAAVLFIVGGFDGNQAVFTGIVVCVLLSLLLPVMFGAASRPFNDPHVAEPKPTRRPEEARNGGPDLALLAPRNLNAPSPHRTRIEPSAISSVRLDGDDGPEALPLRAAPTDPSDANDAAMPAASTASGAMTGSTDDRRPADQVVPPPSKAATTDDATSERSTAAVADAPDETPSTTADVTIPPAERDTRPDTAPVTGAEPGEVGEKPRTLDAPRDGSADDLKRIKGVGPKLEELCNSLGFWHYDQVANWTPAEVAWVDEHLEGFKGRVSRDDWVAQAKLLSEGKGTDFSKRADEGGMY